MAKRRTKEQIELDRQAKVKRWLEREEQKAERERERKATEARKREEARIREELRKQRSRPRVEVPSAYAGESIFVHKRIYERFMQRKDVRIISAHPVGGTGGKLIIEYEAANARGRLELQDLGPMP